MNNYPVCAEQHFIMTGAHYEFKSEINKHLSNGWLIFPDSVQIIDRSYCAVLYKPLNKTYDREYNNK